MRVAVTEHAVDRYIDRVDGAKGFMRESIREIIRHIVEDGFSEKAVRPHPLKSERRIIPFKSGDSVLFLSIGPNTTTFRDADIAVISVLFEHELTVGKVGLGITLEQALPTLKNVEVAESSPPQFLITLGEETLEMEDENELEAFLLGKSKGTTAEVYEFKRRVR